MSINTIKELNKITTIPESNLNKIFDWLELCISHNVCVENEEKPNEPIVLDIGIGNLTITIDSENIKYGFKPSMKLENQMINAADGIDPLAKVLEEKLSEKLLKIYKEI